MALAQVTNKSGNANTSVHYLDDRFKICWIRIIWKSIHTESKTESESDKPLFEAWFVTRNP